MALLTVNPAGARGVPWSEAYLLDSHQSSLGYNVLLEQVYSCHTPPPLPGSTSRRAYHSKVLFSLHHET